MKLVALLVACFLAFASANKCGWKSLEILQADTMEFNIEES